MYHNVMPTVRVLFIAVAWFSVLAGPGHASESGNRISIGKSQPRFILEVTDGDMIIGGGGALYGVADGSNEPPFLTRLSSAGGVVWYREYPELRYTRFHSAAEADSGFYVLGHGLAEAGNPPTSPSAAKQDKISIWSIDTEGDLENKLIELPELGLSYAARNQLSLTDSGDLLILARTIRKYPQESVLIRIDPVSKEGWQHRFQSIATAQPVAMLPTGETALVVRGEHPRGGYQLQVRLLEDDGTTVNTLSIDTNGPLPDSVLGVYPTLDGSGLLVPFHQTEVFVSPKGEISKGKSFYAVQLDTTGQLTFAHRLSHLSLADVAPTPDGGFFFVQGQAERTTVGLYGKDGRLQWEHPVTAPEQQCSIRQIIPIREGRAAIAGACWSTSDAYQQVAEAMIQFVGSTGESLASKDCERPIQSIRALESELRSGWGISISPIYTGENRIATACPESEYLLFLEVLRDRLVFSKAVSLETFSSRISIGVGQQDRAVEQTGRNSYSPEFSVDVCCVDAAANYLATEIWPAMKMLQPYQPEPTRQSIPLFINNIRDHQNETLGYLDFAQAVSGFMRNFKARDVSQRQLFLTHIRRGSNTAPIFLTAVPNTLEVSRRMVNASPDRLHELIDYVLKVKGSEPTSQDKSRAPTRASGSVRVNAPEIRGDLVLEHKCQGWNTASWNDPTASFSEIRFRRGDDIIYRGAGNSFIFEVDGKVEVSVQACRGDFCGSEKKAIATHDATVACQ